MLAAIVANGQTVASLHAWNALSAFFMRQPVSATIATRCGSAFGSGNAREATLTSLAFAGSVVSQTDTGKLDGFESAGSLAVGRCAAVPAATRSVIRAILPSAFNCGQTAGAGSPGAAGGGA
ncbi:Uncharacterised protein [Burkholderia pseudomallei]|nr:hypothetical protein Y045_5570 [Burkholderia pseudomallei MSHR2451]CAJ3160756.1 Uncharacterised protein [Burkholderia pseudomallei]CAJ4357672.1 Uncharacterised protein [Burkholderia pseudomallei]CAJ4377647.1 Uncharacterised protein [Burkholderia pseudomallei]CAJ4818864.1 Uncharacterised protein [Burkholderia pseudomallei]